MLVRPVCLALFACSSLVACGDDNPGGSGDSTGNVDTSGVGDDDPSDPTATTGDDPTTGPAPTSSTTNPATSADDSAADDDDDSGGDTSTTASDDTGDDTGTDTDDPVSPYDGEPLPPADDGAWTWIEFPDARCRDGSPTGIGVRYGSGDGLVFYFEGGGACFNATTCGLNPSSYGEADFNQIKNGGDQNFFSTGSDNPVGDWSFIYVPYCTGDVHAGARPDAKLGDVGGTQQFVGYLNIGQYLDRVVPTFLADTGNVLVSGQSAGGFGAAFNYDRIADAFPNAKVSLLDDSGPPMSDEYMAPCLQQLWREAWGLDDTIPADCAECFPDNGGGIVNLAAFLGEKHKDQRLGLVSSLADNTIRFFFGFGNDNCNTLFPGTSAAKYEMGLDELRDDHLQSPANVWGTYYIDSEQHTWIAGPGYFNQSVDGVKLVDWVADLVSGTATHVAP